MFSIKNIAYLVLLLSLLAVVEVAMAGDAPDRLAIEEGVHATRTGVPQKVAIERKQRSLSFQRKLAQENAQRPHDPKVIELYLESLEADINGDTERQIALLEEVHRLSEPEDGRSLWEVLRLNSSLVPERMYYLVHDLDHYSFKEKVSKLDEFSRYIPGNERVQANLLETMLERMSYDAVLEYCNRRIAEGHNYYRELRAVLRLLIQQEAIDLGIVDYYADQLRKTLKPEDLGVAKLTDELVREEAFQRYTQKYNPTLVEPVQVDAMIEEISQDPTRNVERLRRYCRLLKVAYELTHVRREAIEAYFSYAAEVIASADAEFRRANTPGERDAAKEESIHFVHELESEVEELSEEYALQRRTGNYEALSERQYFVGEISLHKRREHAKALKERGEDITYLSFADVFGE